MLDNGRSASPYLWRSRYALAHKGIEFTSVPLGFTDISTVFGGLFNTVPVLRDGDHVVAESWDIAEYLELRAWFTRSLDLYGGLGRDARMRPLFE